MHKLTRGAALSVLCFLTMTLAACSGLSTPGGNAGDGPGARAMDECSACRLTSGIIPMGADTAAAASAEGGVRQSQAPFIADRVPLRPNTKVAAGSGDFASEDTTTERRELASGGNQYVGTVNFTPTTAGAEAMGGMGPNPAVRSLEGRLAGLQVQAQDALTSGNMDLYRMLADDMSRTEDKLLQAVAASARTVSYVFNLDGSRNVPFGVSNAKTGDQPGADPAAVIPVAAGIGAVTDATMNGPDAAAMARAELQAAGLGTALPPGPPPAMQPGPLTGNPDGEVTR